MSHSTHIATFLLLILISTTLIAAKYYRWQDSDGNWHYTDTIPPEQIKKEHSQLDEHGVHIEKINRAKSLTEIAQEAEVEKLRARQKLILDKQQAEDRVLLRTFRSGDDIIMARDGKLRAVDQRIHLIESNIKRIKQKLLNMQQNAAEMELAGAPLSAYQRKGIDATNQSLKEAYASIIAKKQRKTEIHKKYAHDLNRFNVLRKLSSNQSDDMLGEVAEDLELKNVLNCESDSNCNQAWPRAEQFVRLHATTPIQISGDNIIVTASPKQTADISITISRTRDPQKNRTYLFMDLQCRDSEQGAEFCAGEQVGQIRDQFQGFVGGKL